MQEIYHLHLPVGFKFLPQDDELVCDYLWRKVSDIPLPAGNAVKDCDIYGDKEPWQIWEDFGGSRLSSKEDLFFFTQQKRKSEKGSRLDRRIGSSGGTWHADTALKMCKGRGLTWSHRMFHYENKHAKRHDVQWLMQEYCIDQSLMKGKKNFVLCRIRKLEKKRKLEEVDEGSLVNLAEICEFNAPKRVKLGMEQAKQDNFDDYFTVNGFSEGIESSVEELTSKDAEIDVTPTSVKHAHEIQESQKNNDGVGIHHDFHEYSEFSFQDLYGEDANFDATTSSGQKANVAPIPTFEENFATDEDITGFVNSLIEYKAQDFPIF